MRLVVTGGGTGGHVYPAVAIAKEMLATLPSAEILYIGTQQGMENSIAPREKLEFMAVRSSGVMGKSPFVAAKGLAAASAGVSDALRALRRFRPDVVVGTGGYASGPVMAAAWLLRVPRAIQEQNAVPGKTNVFLSTISNRTFAAWDYSVRFFANRSRVTVTGNPIRGDLLASDRQEGRAWFGLPADGPAVLLLGGSRGARTLAEAGIKLAARLPSGVSMIFITGDQYWKEAAEALGAKPCPGIEGARAGNITLRPYVHDMAKAYGAADLVIGRAGGMTLSEITALGLPSVIVPSPNVAGNHQEYNARALEEAGAATVVREGGEAAGSAPDRIVSAVLTLLEDDKRRSQMANSAKTIGKPSASKDICRQLVDLARTGR